MKQQEEKDEQEVTNELLTTVKIQVVGKYNGHDVKPSGAINFNLKCEYGELVNYIQTIQMLNNDIGIVVKLPNEKPFKIGVFRLNNLTVNGDGEGKLKFNSMTDFVEMNNLNKLAANADEQFLVRLVADIELGEE